jgi:8-amino-7-oxononanoate synthase
MPHLRDLPRLLGDLRDRNLYRDPDGSVAATELVDFSSNDTLGLGTRGWREGCVSRETSLGSGASRAVFGSHAAHLRVERWLSDWLGTEGALLFSSGYAANVGALSALLGPEDWVLSDALNHASLIDGIRLSRAQVHVFPHLDLDDAVRWAEAHPAQGAVWLVLESYYSMDGDSPDLVRARALCDAHGWNLYLDEAHAFGLFGSGRGLAAEYGVVPDVTMLGFGKAIGSAGAAIVGSSAVRQWLWNRARSFLFSTAPSPSGTEALLSQLEAARAAEPARRRVVEASVALRRRLSADGWSLVPGSHGPVLGLVLGESETAQEVARELKARGIRAQAIRPPTVPAGTSRLRLVLSARHSQEDLERLATALSALAPRFAHQAKGARPVGDSSRPPPTSLERVPSDSASPPATPKRIVVLGTGTGIGKTYFATELVRVLGLEGERVLGLKPVESGLGGTPPGQADWEKLGAAGVRACPPCYGFDEPLSPHLCARKAGVTLDFATLRQWLSRAEAESAPTATVLETAGGAFSPLSATQSNAAWIEFFPSSQVVLVVPDRLGVLHDVEACLRALESLRPSRGAERRRPIVDAIVLSAPERPDESTGHNAEELRSVVLSKFQSEGERPIWVTEISRNGALDSRLWMGFLTRR